MESLADYPLKAKTDCRTAVAEQLADLLRSLRFTLPKTTEAFAFKNVYSTWADFSSSAKSTTDLPAAAVLPDRPTYEAAALGPRTIEETWSGGDPCEVDESGRRIYPLGDATGAGFVLVHVAELVIPLVVSIRTTTRAARAAIVRVLEGTLVEDGLLFDPSQVNQALPEVWAAKAHPVRYGRLLELSRYYRRKARYTLLSHTLLDGSDSATENRFAAQFEILSQAPVCVVRRGRGMSVATEIVVNGATETRAG